MSTCRQGGPEHHVRYTRREQELCAYRRTLADNDSRRTGALDVARGYSSSPEAARPESGDLTEGQTARVTPEQCEGWQVKRTPRLTPS